jgi:membrane-associated protease RseP (regulator of RpoE activity)
MATPAILQEGQPSDAPKPRTPSPDRLWVHVLLLAVTFLSTTVIGMRYMENFRHGRLPVYSDQDIFPYNWAFHHLSQFWTGLPFSLTLLGILLTHEFGHYFACRRYGVSATLPFVLPAPSLSGTIGAVIRLRSRVRSREALIVIGALGPIAGFAVALVISCVGISLSHAVPYAPFGLVHFNPPLLLTLLRHLLGHGAPLPAQNHMLWHPVYVASWIGVLITSLNLVPAGQLDGGHILYAIAPRLHRYVTWATMVVLTVLGIWLWMGWLLWVGLLLLPGMRHPRVQDPVPLRKSILALGPICLGLFILCAVPRPLDNLSVRAIWSNHFARLAAPPSH